ncbi:MAG: hypothetical protein H0W73_14200 [Bacteroidetes bacterium]|nr:hypothetical protein [Bacteroidota bacterium]
MKNYFILSTDHRSLSFFWPGKIDTLKTNIFTNSPVKVIKKESNNPPASNTSTLYTITYTLICIVITILIVRKLIAK